MSHEIKTNFNILLIKENIKSIQDAISKMELEGINNPFDFELSIMESHADFYSLHPFLVKKLCKRDDISMLYKMLESLETVEQGSKSLSSVELDLGEKLANEFLYPVINKK